MIDTRYFGAICFRDLHRKRANTPTGTIDQYFLTRLNVPSINKALHREHRRLWYRCSVNE